MEKPYFLWDYNIAAGKIKKILSSSDETAKRWLAARILEHAHFRDVFKFLTVGQITNIFPKLKLRPRSRLYWQRALNAWGYHV